MKALRPLGAYALVVLLLSPPLRAQPLLLIGKADAEISGAFSYDFLTSPLRHPSDKALAEISVNLPINVSAQAQRFLGSVADSAVVMPEIFARVSQHLNAHVAVSAPLFRGTAFFAARENASLTVSGALGDARFNLDTALESGSVLLKGSIHMPMIFDLYWRSLSFGYAFRPNDFVTLAFQVHKHLFGARTAGDLRPDLAGRISVGGADANTSFAVEYPDSKVYGTALGRYEGKAWSPEMGLRLGPLSLVSRMGARMSAEGRLDVDYSLPYFIDPETFQPRFSEPDSFLTADNLRRLLDGETGRKRIHIRDRLILELPQSHTLAWDILRDRLVLSYTRVLGHLSIHGEAPAPSADTAGVAGTDSNLVRTDGYLDFDLFPDHVMTLSGRFAWFHGTLGAHTLNLSYRRRKGLFSGLSPLEWGGDPLVPILDMGFAWGSPLVFALDFNVSPLPAVRSKVTYGF